MRITRLLVVLAAGSACWLGLSGTAAAQPCIAPDNGTGTIDLPPAGCAYTTPGDPYEIINGLPPGTTMDLVPTHDGFSCFAHAFCSLPLPPATCEVSGGTLGGTGNCSTASLQLDVTGTGALTGFTRTLNIPIDWEMHMAARIPGDPVQSFPTDLFLLDGEIFGDPDFCLLRIRAGQFHFLPNPGYTTLTDLADGTFDVFSFFDVNYQIEFQGCPGSVLEGLGGTTTGTTLIQTGVGSVPSIPTLTGPWLWLLTASLGATALRWVRRVRRR